MLLYKVVHLLQILRVILPTISVGFSNANIRRCRNWASAEKSKNCCQISYITVSDELRVRSGATTRVRDSACVDDLAEIQTHNCDGRIFTKG